MNRQVDLVSLASPSRPSKLISPFHPGDPSCLDGDVLYRVRRVPHAAIISNDSGSCWGCEASRRRYLHSGCSDCGEDSFTGALECINGFPPTEPGEKRRVSVCAAS